MTGYDASALSSPDSRILLVGLNWLGDGIMSMPAVQLLREQLPAGAPIDLLLKPGQVDMWELHPAIRKIHKLSPGNFGFVTTANQLRAENYTHAIVLPNSFRSALSPWWAGVACRRGTGGQLRRALLNEVVDVAPLVDEHQQWEMAALLLPERPAMLPEPALEIPGNLLSAMREKLADLPHPWVGLIPGAARGPSKRWPAERYQALAQEVQAKTGGSVLWLGVPDDVQLCERLGQSLDAGRQVNLAGKTRLKEFSAVLALADVVVANDSGGMHLAAAVRTPVVALYGITDPGKTGPLGGASVVLQHSDIRSRAVPRESAEAVAALERIEVGEVMEQVLAFVETAG